MKEDRIWHYANYFDLFNMPMGSGVVVPKLFLSEPDPTLQLSELIRGRIHLCLLLSSVIFSDCRVDISGKLY